MTPPEAIAKLRQEAASATSPAVQRAVARLLGAPPQIADAAVANVAEAGLLGHGIALVVLVAAARRGTDAGGALAGLAEGGDPPRGWSVFEARAAAEEAQEEAHAVLGAVRRDPGTLDLTGLDAPVTAAERLLAGTVPESVVGALAAHRAGVALERAVVDQEWIRVVWSRLGLPWRSAAHSDALDAWGEATLAGVAAPPGAELPGDWPDDWPGVWRGQGGVLARAEDYVDPFERL